MDQNANELIDKLKHAQNVLVTVSKDPSVDQLASAIGLTVALNNLHKHATAVFSGKVPSTLEFLKPEETLEKDTNSLRDFIIALDKAKADKLRYKVEDDVVRIFITPYKTSISDQDLDFSKGDFNVDLVVALGVQAQQDLDEAIQAHGRILHDAAVASIMLDGQGELGTININAAHNSSLSEYTTQLIDAVDKKAIDSQAATALLTGIVAVTERFSNDRTSPQTMTISAELMAAGANQQLIANELSAQEEPKLQDIRSDDDTFADDTAQSDETGTLEISHSTTPDTDADESEADDEAEDVDHQITVDGDGNLRTPDSEATLPEIEKRAPEDINEPSQNHANSRGRVIEPPSHGGTLTANAHTEPLDVSTEELLQTSQSPTELMSHTPTVTPVNDEQPTYNQSPLEVVDAAPQVAAFEPPVVVSSEVPPSLPPLEPFTPVDTASAPFQPAASNLTDTPNGQATLAQIEASVGSAHVAEPVAAETEPQEVVGVSPEEARKAVEAALLADSEHAPLEPVASLNAQPLGERLHTDQVSSTDLPTAQAPSSSFVPAPGFSQPAPAQRVASPSAFPGVVPSQSVVDANPPPPVPPPMIPPLPQ
jgi:hypothetical protein